MSRSLAPPKPLQPSHHERIAALGLRVVSYRNVAQGNEWLPRDMLGPATLVIYRKADEYYSIDGWEPWHDGMFGGRYKDIRNALAWVERAVAVRAALASDFLGV